ncbi:hypothetical protein ABT297_02625 [Dactylosporangium sp. NPDC000555]|uniref:hypothetical protein n=1 Tax=Dactylosporangium sp. NPDC000555 TaxID=3154260 RepID=UPI0033289D8F
MKSRILAAALLTLALAACSDNTGDAGAMATGGASSGAPPATSGASGGAGTGAGPGSSPQTGPSSSASTGGNTTAVDALIAFSRTGGLAGVSDSLVVRPDGSYTIQTRQGTRTGKLAAGELSALKAALASTDFNKMPTVNDNGAVADGYTYMITYAGRQITAKDGAIPPALQPVISALSGFLGK